MKLNIEDFRICVMLEQVNGSIARLNTLTGVYLANRPLLVAMAYVGIIAYSSRAKYLRLLSRVWKKYPRVCGPPSELSQRRTNIET